MALSRFNVYFFLGLLALSGIGVFFMFKPFLSAVILAAIFSALFAGSYGFFRRLFRGSDSLGALATCFLVMLLVVVPVFAVVSLSVQEANSFYHSDQGAAFIRQAVSFVGESEVFGIVGGSVDGERISATIQDFGKGAVGVFGAVFQNVVGFVLWLFVFFFTLFYFLVDGKRMLAHAMRLSPLRDEHEQLLIKSFVSISRATIKGTLIVGVVQGALGGLAFFLLGIPSPVFWGTVMVVLSIIPLIGPGLVWFPAGVILLLAGNIIGGVSLLVFGFVVISLIDNILRPKLVGRDTEMHPLLVFFAIIGGISLFGIFGFLIGPIIMSLFLALAKIYSSEYGAELKECNHNGKV
jgi:predicted PurR-regulated permease PerM